MKAIYMLVIALAATLAIYIFSPRETFIRHNCILSDGPCKLSQDNISIIFTIGPTPLKSQQSVSYKVEVVGIKADKVIIHLIGKSMHMEEDFIELSEKSPGVYSAKRNFPTCSEKKMIWKAVLMLQKENIYVKTIFDLQVTSL
jgi:hypothetical protein